MLVFTVKMLIGYLIRYLETRSNLIKTFMNLIKTATLDDVKSIIEIWEEARLTRPRNNPNDDIKNALSTQTSTILLLYTDKQVIGTVMVGYDGHRGWIYYLAVKEKFQKKDMVNI